MVNANDALRTAAQILKDANIDEALPQARLLFKFITNRDYRLLPNNFTLSEPQAESLYTVCRKRATHYPLQYILGKWPFMDLELLIGEGVLIPRADTELICEGAAEICAGLSAPIVLDLCAGSGAIALGIKSLVPSAQVTAVELMDEAYKYLLLNSRNNIQCVKHDVFKYQDEIENESIDIIVSNPPYIASHEMPTLQKELSFEPRSALTDEGSGLSFYAHIAKAYFTKIKRKGHLIFEIGSSQAQAVTDICKAAGYCNLQLRFDLSRNARAVFAQKP